MRQRPSHVAVPILATALMLAACGGGSADKPEIHRSASATAPPRPSPSVVSTAGATIGTTIDISALTGRIVFSSGIDDVWVIGADGSGPKRLTTDPAHDFDPSLSPDGQSIAFRSERDGNNEVYVMNADGSGQHAVSQDPADDWGPAWSPDGRVVWNCARDLTVGFHACVANADGSGIHVIPNDRYFEYGSWSPDGSKIAFMSQQPDARGNDPNYDIYVMNADGSGLTQLTDAPGEDGFPSWSPDGTSIAFSSTRDDCSHSNATDCRTTGDIGPYQTIYIMNADGSDQHRLSLQLGMFVDWSPDGQYLVFSPGLNVIRPDGTGLTQIPSAGEVEFADWGP